MCDSTLRADREGRWLRRHRESSGSRRASPCSLRCARSVTPAACSLHSRWFVPVRWAATPPARRDTGKCPRVGRPLARSLSSPWSEPVGTRLRPAGYRRPSTALSGGSGRRSLSLGPRLRRFPPPLRAPPAGSAGPGARGCPLCSPRGAGANGIRAGGHPYERKAA